MTRTHLSRLVRSILLETVKDNHGVFVSSLADVTWTPEKTRIPFRDNPFVGGSPAFAAWLNDGETKRRFRKEMYVGTPDQTSFLMTVDDYVKEGEWVIIPTLWNEYKHVYRVESIHGGPSRVPGTPSIGDYSLALCTLVRIKDGVPTRLNDVGLAFLKRVGSKTKDSIEAEEQAYEVMSTWERPKSVETRSSPPPQSDAPASPREPERRVIRRVGGVAAPAGPAAPRQMSGDEVRDMLGLRRLRETDEIQDRYVDGRSTDMATQFNRRQIRALIRESLSQMVYDMPSDMYDEEMEDEEMPGDKYRRSAAAARQKMADTEAEMQGLSDEMQGRRNSFLSFMSDAPAEETDWADYVTDDDDIPFGAADVADLMGRGDD